MATSGPNLGIGKGGGPTIRSLIVAKVGAAFQDPPFSQYDWPLPIRAVPPPPPTWTWSYNLNLIGQDRMVVGEASTDLTPPLPRGIFQTWVSPLNLPLLKGPAPLRESATFRFPHFTRPREPERLIYDIPPNLINLLVPPPVDTTPPFSQEDWPLTPAAPQFDRSFTFSYNPNLVTQVQLPVGAISAPLPVGPEYAVQLRQWFGNIPPVVVTIAIPFAQYDWPVPQAAAFQLREWYGRIPPVVVTVPFNQDDWPNPRGVQFPADLGSITASYNLSLIGQDKLPAGEIVTDLPPRAPQQPTPVFTASYNKNLIGQDKLPSGKTVTDLPPQPPLSAIQLRTWINTVNLGLISGPQVRPFVQSDWPINIGPRQPIQTFVGSYNKNLIGKDRLPTGARITDLPPQPTVSAFQTWINAVNLALIPVVVSTKPVGAIATDLVALPLTTPDTWVSSVNIALNILPPPVDLAKVAWRAPYFSPPRSWPQFFAGSILNTIPLLTKPIIPTGPTPFNQYSWPLPRGYTPGYEQRYSVTHQGNPILPIFSPPISPIPPPPEPTPPEDKRIIYNAGNEWQQLDRIREPGPVGWR